MSSIVNANTLSIGAGAVDTIWGITGSGTGPSRVIVRTTSAGVLVGGADLVSNGYGFELQAGKEYTFDLRFREGQFPSASNEGSLNVKNTGGSSATVSFIAVPLA